MGTLKARKNQEGKMPYYAEVRRKGFPALYKSFSRMTDARCWIQDTESGIRSGRYLPQAEAQRHKLSDAIDRFIVEELPKKPKCQHDQLRHLIWFNEHAGTRSLADISPAILTELKGLYLRGQTRYKQPPKPQTWNRYISSLSCVFPCCIRDWEWLETNPARRIRREREAPGRIRFLSDDERDRLLTACRNSESKHLYPFVVLALSSGMRRSEIRLLTWEQVDLSTGILTLTRTKNSTSRRVPVRGLALTLLREHAKVRRIDNNFVFPGESRAKADSVFIPDNSWYKALEKAKIKDFRLHDLRHSTASYLAMNGASILEIAEVLGHKTLQMVKRYSHLAESHIAGVVERMNKKIFGA